MNIRCYAQHRIFDEHLPYVMKLLEEEHNLNILPSVQLGNYLEFSCDEQNDYSIIIYHEYFTDRESQTEWFLRHTRRIVENTRKKLLFLIYCGDNPDKLDERKSFLPNATFHYFNLYSHSKDISCLNQPIIKFLRDEEII